MNCLLLQTNIVRLLLTIAIFSGYVSEANQITATAYPVATTKLIGNSVQFECNVSEPPGSSQTLQWYIEFDEDTEHVRHLLATSTGDISVANRPEFRGRGDYETKYEVENTATGYKNHKCTLNIGETTLKDNGYFGCTHETPGESHRTLLDQKARLTIVPQPTANPECNLNKHNKVFVLTCVSLQGDPKAHLTWYEGNEVQSEAIQTFNSIEITEVDNQDTRTFECHAKQGEKDVGTCAVTLTGDTGEVAPVESQKTTSISPFESQLTTFISPFESQMTTSISPQFESQMTTSISPFESQMTTSISPAAFQLTTTNSPVIPVVYIYSTTGLIIDIVLGTFILILLLVLIHFLYRRRKQQQQGSTNTEKPTRTARETNDPAENTNPSNSVYLDLDGGSYMSPYMEANPVYAKTIV